MFVWLCLIIYVSLSSCYYGINPNTCGRIRCCLQMVTSFLCLNNKCTMWPSTFRCIHMIKINLIDCLSFRVEMHKKKNVFKRKTKKNNQTKKQNIQKNKLRLEVYAPIYQNNKSTPFFACPIQTIVLTIHGMWHPAYVNT